MTLRGVLSSVRRNKARTLLALSLMSLTYFPALLTLTNSLAFYTQMSDVKRMFRTELSGTYRVDAAFIQNEDTIGADFEELRAFVNSRENSVYGAFSRTSVYFEELADNAEYIELNRKLRGDVPFENWLAISDVVFVDPEILEIIEFDLSSSDLLPVELDGERYLPLYAGKALDGIVSNGDILTFKGVGEKYIVAGFYENTRWLNEDDPVTQPPRSIEYGFIAPFSEAEKQIPRLHNMTRHSTVGRTFLHCAPDTAAEFKKRAAEMGIKFNVTSLEDFIDDYSEINGELLGELLFLAVLVSLCSEISIASVLCVNVLLKKRECGIKIAFGGTVNGIILSLGAELLLLDLLSGIIGFAAAYRSFSSNIIDSIRDINLRTLVCRSLPCLLILVVICAALVLMIPAVMLKRYDPAVLIREEE